MSMRLHEHLRCIGLSAALCISILALPASARDAAFLDPGSSSGTANASEAIRVEPKNDIDIGDSALNIARRTTLFFTNQTNAPVQIAKIAINADSNVTAEISNDDCTKQGTLTTGSRCSVEVSITPNSGGTWSVEVLMTHNGIGRITRAKISGKTTGASNTDKKDNGLFLSTKDVKSVDFGEVQIGEGKTVRSALMVNDSPETITLYSIDVIEAENGLQRLDQGCAIDMELKPGESCPVTLVWTPTIEGRVSTDLIIRHSGRLGFAVIPIRGTTKGGVSSGPDSSKSSSKTDIAKMGSNSGSIPSPPSKLDLDKLSDKIPPMSVSSLGGSSTTIGDGAVHLIGTVGTRALLYRPDGTTAIADVGDEIDVGNQKAKLISVAVRSADIMIGGKKKHLVLETVQALTDQARSMKKQSGPSSTASTLSPLSPDYKPSSTALLPMGAPSGSSPYGGAK
jgi:Abnormal spindle-like microcephaly-assoc'd, ASPM-SPD-2-Hydin